MFIASSRVYVLGCIAVLLLTVLFSQPAAAAFMTGTSIRGGSEQVPYVTGLKPTHTRVYVNWNAVESTVIVDSSISLATLRQSGDWIPAYAAQLKWNATDSLVNALVAAGITPMIEIGEGTTHCLPTYNGAVADPNLMTQELYLAYQYRYARAVVNRYKDRVTLYQIENELNEAQMEMAAGIRVAEPALTNAWSNWSFLGTLLQTLSYAVHDESASLQTMHNFHTDVPQSIHEMFHVNGFYLQAMVDWYDSMDIIGLDGYPNYVGATPVNGSALGLRVQAAYDMMTTKSLTKKGVMIVETSYPIAATASTNPSITNYTDANQVAYYKEAFQACVDAGAIGFFDFGTFPNAGFNAPSGGYTETDITALTLTSNVVIQAGSPATVKAFTKFAATNAGYMATTFPSLAFEVEGGWGTLTEDNTPRPGYTALAKLFASQA